MVKSENRYQTLHIIILYYCYEKKLTTFFFVLIPSLILAILLDSPPAGHIAASVVLIDALYLKHHEYDSQEAKANSRNAGMDSGRGAGRARSS